MADDAPNSSARRRALLGVLAVLLVAAVALLVVKFRSPPIEPPGPKPKPVVVIPKVPVTELAEARIVGIRRTSDKHLRLLWSFPATAENELERFVVEVADTEGYGIPISPALPPSTRTWTDTRSLREGEVLLYSIHAIGKAGAHSYSSEERIIYRDVAVPPAPADLRTTFEIIRGRPFANISWRPASADDRVTRGYRVYESRSPAYRFSYVPRTPTGSTPLLLELPPDAPKPFALEVVAVAEAFQESEPVRITVTSPFEFPATPTSARVQREDVPNSPLRLTWTYTANTAAAPKGFRIYEGELMVASESDVGPDRREWTDPVLIGDRKYRYAVVAVGKEGLESAPAPAPEFLVPRNQVLAPVMGPTALTANWEVAGNGLAIQLQWEPPPKPAPKPKGYIVEGAVGAANAPYRVLTPNAALTETSFRFTPTDLNAPHSFKVYATADDGRRSEPIAVAVATPEQLITPARLADYRVIEEGTMQRLEWVWRYPSTALLRGFRLYQDGVLVADESKLPAEARSWTTAPLTKGALYRFEIEAVARTGQPAPRAPAHLYKRL